ncbi:hypothetical protein BS47DRAFT_1390566 [Hydnum rufescens UP504]|uniref:CCHC-type domain-containing protein n=1 Tax=Hydnum rufescens UP504 TaxID=1448309 RepID=A0A9P6DVT1_9AGAM|nr:hypothetical protein BS47DRAFT_1390566 [Hydnum rufescens UP504]
MVPTSSNALVSSLPPFTTGVIVILAIIGISLIIIALALSGLGQQVMGWVVNQWQHWRPCQHLSFPRSPRKRILCFLAEYEFCATAAHLTPTQTIRQITRYCDTKSERFIESLDEYYNDDWDAFKSRLLDYYPLEEEKPYYKVDHLLKLVRKDRKLSSIEKFDNYIREFMVIVRVLEDRKALSQTDKYDYFWRGVKPVSFHEEIGNVPRNSKLWTDLTNPPPMNEATQAIKLRLKRDLYHVPDDDGLNEALEDDKSADTTDSDDNSGTDDSDDETRKVKSKKHQAKLEIKQKKEEGTTKPLDSKVQEPGDPMKSNIDDLAEKIGRLTIALGQFDPDKVACRPGKFNVSSIKCFMCGEQGHSLRECPETKAFIMKKVLKISNEGRLIVNTSNVETEHLRSFELLNQEFAVFGDYEYEVFPAEKKAGGSQTEVKAYVELPQHPVRQVPPTDNPKDIEMCDATMDQPASRKHKETLDNKGSPVAKAKSKTNPTLEDVVVRSKTEHSKKRASPVYRFTSELQENVDVEALYKSLMEKQVTVKLGDVLGSSLELCKRLQTATKTQCIPIKPEIAGSHNVEAIVSSLESIFGLPSKDLGDLSDNLTPTEPTEFKPGKLPKRPLINRPPKKPLDREINVVAFESDDSEDNYTSDDSGLNTEDQVEQYYRRQLEKEHNRVFNVRDLDFSFHPSFLAMVMAKIQGTIMGQPCTMLIDSGSELNMMVQSTQVKLELPMDPIPAEMPFYGLHLLAQNWPKWLKIGQKLAETGT